MPSGGDILTITCNHPTLGSFTFSPKSGEDSTYQIGGIVSADDDGAIEATGEMLDKMTRMRPSFEVPLGWDMTNPNRQELEALSLLQSTPIKGDWTMPNINGTVYRLHGKPVGMPTGNGNEPSIKLKLQGDGTLEII